MSVGRDPPQIQPAPNDIGEDQNVGAREGVPGIPETDLAPDLEDLAPGVGETVRGEPVHPADQFGSQGGIQKGANHMIRFSDKRGQGP